MVLSDTSKGDIGWKKWLVAGWAFMECLLFGGLLYGWSSVVFVLKTEGVYADLCPPSDLINNGSIVTNVSILNVTSAPVGYTIVTGNGSEVASTPGVNKGVQCKPQDGKMALCFSIASALFCIGSAVMGQIQYKYGTRVTRLIAAAMFFAGSLMMAFISVDLPWLMFPGLSLLGLGGLPLLVTNAQVSNLFLVGSSSIVGLLCGGFDGSSTVMLAVKIAHENGFARKNMFIVITVMYSLVLVSTFFFLPKHFITKPMVKVNGSEVAGDVDVGVELLPDGDIKGDKVTPDKPELPSLKSCLLRPVFILHVVWMCLLQVRFYYFLGTLNQYLNRLLDEDEDQVSYFTNICFYTMMGGLISSFFSGIVYDCVKRCCKDGKSQAYREVLPAALPLAIASLLSVLLSILVLIPSIQLLYLIFIVMTVKRSFLYSMGAAFLSALFPSEYFGLLYGIMIMCAGIFGMLQYVFFLWAESYAEGGFHANIFQLVLVSLSFVHPLYLWITCWKEEKKFKVN